MDIKTQIKVENVIITLNEDEADMLKDLLEFAFDYDTEHPHSLYTSEKILGRELIDRLNFDFQSAKAEEKNHKSFREMSNEELEEYYNNFIKDNPKCQKIFVEDKEEKNNEKKV